MSFENSLWNVIHVFTFLYPENPSYEDKINYLIFFLALENVFPCLKCKKTLKELTNSNIKIPPENLLNIIKSMNNIRDNIDREITRSEEKKHIHEENEKRKELLNKQLEEVNKRTNLRKKYKYHEKTADELEEENNKNNEENDKIIEEINEEKKKSVDIFKGGLDFYNNKKDFIMQHINHHNMINKENGKREYTYEEVSEFYSDMIKTSNIINKLITKQQTTHTTHNS